MSNAPQTVIHVNNQGSSALGVAGLAFSVLGWLTCGLLCIPGTVLSFLGLFSSKPKGMAIAGLIVGFPGSLFFIFIGLGMLTAALGLGTAVSTSVADARAAAQRSAQQAASAASAPPVSDSIAETTQAETISDIPEPIADIPEPVSDIPEPVSDIPEPTLAMPTVQPTESTPMPTVEPEPEPEAISMRRTFSNKTGKLKIDATVLAYKAGWLRLHREDSGKDISVEVKNLSDEDQSWVADNLDALKSLK